MKPAVSIITPVYNGLPFLKECVESVLKQSFQDWEMLISDDGSKDGSREYLGSLNDPRIKIHYQGKNKGIFGNLNFLFDLAQAEYSQILCQDDYFVSEGSLATIVKYWETAGAHIGYVRFNYHELSRSSTVMFLNKIPLREIPPEDSKLWFFVFGNFPGNLSNMSLRTTIVKELGQWDQGLPFAGDFDFWLRASNKYTIGIERAVVVYVRRHQNVASNFLSTKGELFIQHLRIYGQLIEKLSANYPRKVLVDYFNRDVCSFHYRTAIRTAIQGDFTYLKNFATIGSSITWPKPVQLIACLPYALFNGTQKYTVKFARKFITPKLKAAVE